MDTLFGWLASNKEWLFSGIGVTTIGFLLKWLFSFKLKKFKVSYSYTRAFGATQVPLFLRAMESEHPLNSLGTLLAEKKKEFWESWPHKNCTIISTNAYAEMFDENLGFIHGQKLLESVALENPVSADFYKTKIDYDLVDKKIPNIQWWALIPFRKYEIFRQVSPGNYSTVEVQKAIAKASEEIGFLLFFMKNESDEPLNDVRMLYKRIPHPKPLEYAVVKKDMMKMELKEMVIKHFKPREELLLLLEVYRRDVNGYPLAYYSSLNLPTEIRVGSRFRHQKIASPNRDQAAKIPFPFGWIGQ